MYFEGFTEELMLLNCSSREDSLESLGQQGDQTSQPWVFIGKTDAESEAPIFWPPDAKNQLIEKKKKKKHTLIVGKIEGRRRRGQQRIWLDSID